MNPTIAAAWISGGVGAVGIVSTAITAWIGSRSTRKATEQAIAAGADNTRATLAAAREDRLWEKRCAAYEEIVAGLLHRQAMREDELPKYQVDEKSAQYLQDFLPSYEPPGWVQAQARLFPYGSDAVVAACAASTRADNQVWRLYIQWQLMTDDAERAAKSGGLLVVADAETMLKARKAFDQAIQTAQNRDMDLIEVIRGELRSKPEAVMPPPPALPAVRRRFWLRRRG
jgi:hypothetical protein